MTNSQTPLGQISIQQQLLQEFYPLIRECLFKSTVCINYELINGDDINKFNFIELEEYYTNLINEDENKEEIDYLNYAAPIAVCGGAPRDWNIGKPASDIDMYIAISNLSLKLMLNFNNSGKIKLKSLINYIENYFVNKGFTKDVDFKIESSTNNIKYVGTNYIDCVISFNYKGLEFDLIFIDIYKITNISYFNNNELCNLQVSFNQANKTFGFSFNEFITSTYDFNISKFSYDLNNNKIIPTYEGLKDIEDKTLTLNKHISENSISRLKCSMFKHYPKLAKKFPDYKFIIQE